jgi:hypothetical protein
MDASDHTYKRLRRVIYKRIYRTEGKDKNDRCYSSRPDIGTVARLYLCSKCSDDSEDDRARQRTPNEARSPSDPIVSGCSDYGAHEGTSRVDEVKEKFCVL